MWLSIRNRISPGLYVCHVALYLCSESSFVFWIDFRGRYLKSKQMLWLPTSSLAKTRGCGLIEPCAIVPGAEKISNRCNVRQPWRNTEQIMHCFRANTRYRSENPRVVCVFVSPVLIPSSTYRRVDYFHPTRYGRRYAYLTSQSWGPFHDLTEPTTNNMTDYYRSNSFARPLHSFYSSCWERFIFLPILPSSASFSIRFERLNKS